MRGSIRKRYQNSYTIRLSLGVNPLTGKRQQKSISVKGTRKEAETRLSELLRQLDTGSFIKPGKTLTGEYLKQWLKDYQANLSARSFERYRDIVEKNLIPALGKIPLVQLRPEHIQAHYTAKLAVGMSARTVRYHHAVLHVALKTAVEWGLLVRNPADAIKPPKAKRPEMQTWNEYELEQFLDATKDSFYYPVFYTALFTGMRRSELLALRWQDIDFLLGQISVVRGLQQLRDNTLVFSEPKSEKSRRVISLPPSAIILLRKYHETKKLEALTLAGC